MSLIPIESLANGTVYTTVPFVGPQNPTGAEFLTPAAGQQVHVYAHGTTTPAAVYTDEAGQIRASQPLVSAADGSVPGFIDPATLPLDLVVNGATYELAAPGSGGSGAIASVNGKTGVVVLTASDVGADASGAAATVQTALTSEVTRAQAAEALLAPKASPALTGTPTAPTPTVGDNSTRIATTAFVGAAGAGGDTSGTLAALTVNTVQGKSPIVYLAPSGDVTGVADRTAINAALSAGKRVIGVPGASYYLDQPVIMPSNGYIDMSGCTINMVTVALNMLRNSATLPTTTAVDGACTAATTTLTSAALAAVAQAGDAIGVVGAGYGASTWYGTVTGVVGNNITLSKTCQATIASGATCYRYATRDHDITIIGGTWSFPDPGFNGHAVNATALNNFLSCLRRIDRLTVSGVRIAFAGAGAQGGRFSISIGDCTDVDVDGIRFLGTAGDGVHLTGPISRASVTNIFGTTGDDFVVCNTTDAGTPNITDTQGDITDLVCERLFPNNAKSAWKYYDSDSSHKYFTATDLTVRSVHGAVTVDCVRVDGGSNVYGVVIDDINVRGPAGKEQVTLNNPSASDSCVTNVTWSSTNAATSGIVNASAPGRNCRIEDIRFMTAPAGTNIGVKIGNSGGMYDWVIRNVKQGGTPTTFIPVQLNGGTIQKLTLADLYLSSSSGVLVQFAAVTTVVNLHLEDLVAAVLTGVSIPSGNAATVIRAKNVQFSGTDFITSQSPFTLKAVNLDVNTTGAVVALTGAGATPVNLWLANYAQAGAGADTSKDGAQVITLNKATYTTTTP